MSTESSAEETAQLSPVSTSAPAEQQTQAVPRTGFFKRHRFLVTWIVLAVLTAVIIALNAHPRHQVDAFLKNLPGCAIGWGLLVGMFYLGAQSHEASKRRQAEQTRAADEAEAQRRQQFHDFLRTPMKPIASANLVLKSGEQCFWNGSATLYTMHKHTHYVGASGGASFRVARGLWLRSGSFRGAPVTTQKMESDGAGSLYLTNKRLLFVGNTKSVEIPFTKIASTEPYSDGMRVDVINKAPVVLVTGDIWLYMLYYRLKEGLTDAVPESALSAHETI